MTFTLRIAMTVLSLAAVAGCGSPAQTHSDGSTGVSGSAKSGVSQPKGTATAEREKAAEVYLQAAAEFNDTAAVFDTVSGVFADAANAGDPEQLLAGATAAAGEYAEALRRFNEIMTETDWPADAQSAVDALVAANAADRDVARAMARAEDARAFFAAHAALGRSTAPAAVKQVRARLGLPSSS